MSQFQYQCYRKRLDKEDKGSIARARREAEKTSNPSKAFSLYRRGSGLRESLWLVGTKEPGVPFVEAFLERVTDRPAICFSRYDNQGREEYWAALCELDDQGKELVREIQIPHQDGVFPGDIVANLAVDTFLRSGKVFCTTSTIPDDFEIAIDGDEGKRIENGERSPSSILIRPKIIHLEKDKAKVETKKVKSLTVPSTKLSKLITSVLLTVFVSIGVSTVNKKQEEIKVETVKRQDSEYREKFEQGSSSKVALLNVYKMMVGTPRAASSEQIGFRDGAKGWHPAVLEVTPNQVMIKMVAGQGARIGEVEKVAVKKTAGMVVISDKEVAVVKEFCRTPVLARPNAIPIDGVAHYVVSAFRMYAPSASLAFGSDKKMEIYATRELNVSVENVSSETLDIIGTLLNHLPISFKGATLEVDPADGYLDGEIRLEMIGCTYDDVDSRGRCNRNG